MMGARRQVRITAAASLAAVLSTTGCDGLAGPLVDCGPLAPADCEEQTALALAYAEQNFSNGEIRIIRFTHASGSYTVVFANGDEAFVTR